jgi:hypothetical protein
MTAGTAKRKMEGMLDYEVRSVPRS